MTIERYYNEEGKVGVLVSPGYGAGWSSWVYEDEDEETPNNFKEFITFDKGLVELVLEEAHSNQIEDYIEEKYPGNDFYVGGMRNVMVHWMPKGTRFTIEEYDGYESIRTVADLAITA